MISNFTVPDEGLSNIPFRKQRPRSPALVDGHHLPDRVNFADLQYSLVLTLNTLPLVLTIYTVRVQWSQNGAPNANGNTNVVGVRPHLGGGANDLRLRR